MPELNSSGTYFYSVKAVKASGGESSSCSNNLQYNYQEKTAIPRLEINSIGIPKNYSNRDMSLTTDLTPNLTVVSTEDIQGGKVQVFLHDGFGYCNTMVQEFDIPSGTPVTSFDFELSTPVVPDTDTGFDFLIIQQKLKQAQKDFRM